jgi:hypothetical protein
MDNITSTRAEMTPGQTQRAAQYCEGYRAGLSDARGGTARDTRRHGERYAAGYGHGMRWGLTHPAPSVLLTDGRAR